MQALAKSAGFPLDFDRQVRQFGWDVFFEETGFYSAGSFEHFLPIVVSQKIKYL